MPERYYAQKHFVEDISLYLEQMGLPEAKLRYTGGSRGWPGDVPRICLGTSRMEKLGWRAEHSSEEAIRLTIKEILAESI